MLTAVTVAFLLFLAYTAFKRPQQVPLLGWISAIWIVSNYAYLSCVYYRPLRHDLPLLLPTIFLVTLALYQFSGTRRIRNALSTTFKLFHHHGVRVRGRPEELHLNKVCCLLILAFVNSC